MRKNIALQMTPLTKPAKQHIQFGAKKTLLYTFFMRNASRLSFASTSGAELVP